jgi:hypothetical protein
LEPATNIRTISADNPLVKSRLIQSLKDPGWVPKKSGTDIADDSELQLLGIVVIPSPVLLSEHFLCGISYLVALSF